MPAEDIARLQTQYAGFLDAQIAIAQSWVETRLRKRYAIPFVAGAEPEAFLGWIVALVTLAGYQRRGFNPSSAENQLIVDAATMARAEVKEAADSKDGLFELPVRQDNPAGAVTQGAPLSYAEASPYTWTDRQADIVNGGGG